MQGLVYIARHVGEHFQEFIDQPWVQQGKNLSAIESLGNLARWESSGFRHIMAHPEVSDGITPEEAKVVAVLHGVQRFKPHLVDILLDPKRVTLEERKIVVPQSGELLITIIRTEPGAERTMDLLEEAIRAEEEFMALPWPKKGVIYFFDGELVTGVRGSGGRGVHLGTFIASRTFVDSNTYSIERASNHFAHELGHFFWRDSEQWITEGGAIFLEAIVWNARRGWPIEPEHQPCSYAGSITELQKIDIEHFPGARICPHSLGQRLWHDLYRNLDSATFRQGFRRLFLLSKYDDPDDDCRGTYLGICHLRAAFKAEATMEVQRAVDKVISRWYYGTESLNLNYQYQDNTPADPRIPTINGHIGRVWLSTEMGGRLGVSSISTADRPKRLYLNLEYSYDDHTGPSLIPFQFVQYFSADGFNFNRRQHELPVDGSASARRVSYSLGGESTEGATGLYWVYVYWEQQKVAEVFYDIEP